MRGVSMRNRTRVGLRHGERESARDCVRRDMLALAPSRSVLVSPRTIVLSAFIVPLSEGVVKGEVLNFYSWPNSIFRILRARG